MPNPPITLQLHNPNHNYTTSTIRSSRRRRLLSHNVMMFSQQCLSFHLLFTLLCTVALTTHTTLAFDIGKCAIISIIPLSLFKINLAMLFLIQFWMKTILRHFTNALSKNAGILSGSVRSDHPQRIEQFSVCLCKIREEINILSLVILLLKFIANAKIFNWIILNSQ